MVVVWKLKESKQARGGTDINFYFATYYQSFYKKDKAVYCSSLDGYIAREDDILDWLYRDGDYGYAQSTIQLILFLWAQESMIKY